MKNQQEKEQKLNQCSPKESIKPIIKKADEADPKEEQNLPLEFDQQT